MYFAKDEIIELNDNKKYLVIDTSILNDIVYYKIKEINAEETQTIGNPIYITTTNKQGKLYINDKLSANELEKVKELFKD